MHEDLIELAASARKRKTAHFAQVHKREIADALDAATAPLKERIAELEGLLGEAVKRGDALAVELEKCEAQLADCKAQNATLKSQLKAQTAKAAPDRAKRGK